MATPARRCFRWPCGIFTFLVMTLGELPHTYGDNSKPATIETIINTWRERESRARSLDFVALGTEFRPSSTFSVDLLGAMGRPSEKDISVPDTSFNIRLRLVIDGNGRYRLDHEGKAPAPTEKGYPDESFIDIFENGVRNTFFPVGGSGFPSAHIRKSKSPTAVGNPQVLPIRIVYRPFDREIGGFDASKLTLTNDKGIVEGHPCLILTHLEKTIWVDPARDFVPTRYFEVVKGVTTRHIDIRYASDVQHGWVPASWNNVCLYLNGNTRESVRATVAEYRIGQAISNETFEVQYPPGTWVNDYLKGETYILREDGTRRMVLNSEKGEDYEYLLHTNSPNSLGRFPWIVGISILLLVIVVAVFYRALKPRRSHG